MFGLSHISQHDSRPNFFKHILSLICYKTTFFCLILTGKNENNIVLNHISA